MALTWSKNGPSMLVELGETLAQKGHNMALAWFKKLDIQWTALFDQVDPVLQF